MALSDSEQRRLDEIERALLDEDPHIFPHFPAVTDRRRPILTALVLLLIGMPVLIVGLVLTAVTLAIGSVISVVGAATIGTAVLLVGLPFISARSEMTRR
jgi:hypothetical protein